MIDDSTCGALSEEMIDRILADSFPASDPPPWTLGREIQPPSTFVDNSKDGASDLYMVAPGRIAINDNQT